MMGLKEKTILVFAAAVIIMAAMLFIPAGTLDYWQAWVFLAVLFVPVAFVGLYFLKNDPEFLERRMKTKEKEAAQRSIIKVGYFVFITGFLVPGLDHRFGWSDMPAEISLIADLAMLLGYAICFLAFRENSYASRVVEVVEGQKVIATGPYSMVRHPMYVGVAIMYMAIPFALGSYYALIFFLPIIPMLIYRILNEEEVLMRELEGYREYCRKTRYRLVPGVW
jgi:protein-S-isoprenylcysteine O-methyltransferase Ste14